MIATRGGLATGDRDTAVEALLIEIEPLLWRAARRLTRDRDLQADLVQEARVRLWEIDPTRFDLGNREDRWYLGRVLRNRMWRVWTGELHAALREGRAARSLMASGPHGRLERLKFSTRTVPGVV